MYGALEEILEIQEYDMQMIQLIRLKRERQKELNHINAINTDLKHKTMIKEGEIIELKKNMRIIEGEVKEISEKIKRLEGQQNQVKKVDEFNALSHEISRAERERVTKKQVVTDLQDQLTGEEEILKTLTDNMTSTTESSQVLETEIRESLTRINEEGCVIKEKRDQLVEKANPDVFHIYEGLLKNKKDRVVVSIENRCCSGCHIMLTAQHENLVRKGERLVFCEHCSRIHFWQESEELEGAPEAAKQRRRRRRTKA
ncbi:MAG: C4-type zinc ribbon domain-containing protein [Waddliaceae bacterium]